MRPLFEGVSLPSCPSTSIHDMNDRLQGFCRRRVGFRIPEHGASVGLTKELPVPEITNVCCLPRELCSGAIIMARMGSESGRSMAVTKYPRAITATECRTTDGTVIWSTCGFRAGGVSVLNCVLNRPRSLGHSATEGRHNPTLADPSDHPLRDRLLDG